MPSACVPPPAGIVAWWPGDGNANDIAGATSGTLLNGATFAPGEVDQAFSFSGANAQVLVANAPSLEPAHVTVEAWVNATNPGRFRYIVAKGDNNDGGGPSYALYTGQFGGLFFVVWQGASNPDMFVLSPDAGTGVWNGNWHHVAGTFDGARVRLFLDGLEIGAGTSTTFSSIGYNANHSNDLVIGNYPSTATSFNFSGNIDEVSIYNHALDAAEIQAIYNAGSDGKCKAVTDLAPTQLAWNPTQGGVDFSYQVTGADLPQDTTAALYWASGPTFADAIGGPVYSTTIDHPVSTYGPFYVPNSVLGAPPPNATHLLLVVDPPDAQNPKGLIQESDETNNVLPLQIPDIAVQSATSKDPGHVTFTYQMTNDALSAATNPSFEVAVYRSADKNFNPDAIRSGADEFIIDQTVSGLDDQGASAIAVGSHTETIDLQGQKLGIDPSHPYVFMVADPNKEIPDLHETNNTASFKKHVLGVVTHGFELDGQFPTWVTAMAGSLNTADGYEDAIPFDWADQSRIPAPDFAVNAGHNLAFQIRSHARALASGADFGAGDVIDLHVIGHSRGAVVISQALQDLELQSVPQLEAGYVKMTMLDPHPAHNHFLNPQFSVPPGPIGWLASLGLIGFQAVASDPEVTVPSNVSEAEVYFQHTPSVLTFNPVEMLLNLWGEVPVASAIPVQYYDLTGPGMGHEEVHEWYQNYIVPTLAGPSSFAYSNTATQATAPGLAQQLQGQTVPVGILPAMQATTGTNVLYPALVDNRGVANSLVQELGAAEAAYERGKTTSTLGTLTAFAHHVEAQRGKHLVTEAADFLTEMVQLVMGGLQEGPTSAASVAGLDTFFASYN